MQPCLGTAKRVTEQEINFNFVFFFFFVFFVGATAIHGVISFTPQVGQHCKRVAALSLCGQHLPPVCTCWMLSLWMLPRNELEQRTNSPQVE